MSHPSWTLLASPGLAPSCSCRERRCLIRHGHHRGTPMEGCTLARIAASSCSSTCRLKTPPVPCGMRWHSLGVLGVPGKSRAPDSLTFDRKSISGEHNLDTWDRRAGPARPLQECYAGHRVLPCKLLFSLRAPQDFSPLFIIVRVNWINSMLSTREKKLARCFTLNSSLLNLIRREINSRLMSGSTRVSRVIGEPNTKGVLVQASLSMPTARRARVASSRTDLSPLSRVY